MVLSINYCAINYWWTPSKTTMQLCCYHFQLDPRTTPKGLGWFMVPFQWSSPTGGSINVGTLSEWMDYFMENLIPKWIFGGIPHFRKAPNSWIWWWSKAAVEFLYRAEEVTMGITWSLLLQQWWCKQHEIGSSLIASYHILSFSRERFLTGFNHGCS